MGDMGDIFNAMRDHKRDLRERFGIQCPRCKIEQPKRQPTILLPGQRCRVHKPAYVDPRPRLTDAERYPS